MEKKSSIKMYRKYKKNIKQEKIYDNRWSSVLLFQARVNMMELNDKKGMIHWIQDVNYAEMDMKIFCIL